MNSQNLFVYHLMVASFLLFSPSALNGQELVGSIIVAENQADGTGDAVAMDDSGTRIIFGSDQVDVNFREQAGEAKVYELIGGEWQQLGQTIIGETAGEFVGHGVCISSAGDRIAVGSKSGVRVYDLENSSWEQVGELMALPDPRTSTRIGSIRFSKDGQTIAFGGSVEEFDVAVYSLVNGEWEQKGGYFPTESLRDIAFSGDGNRIVIYSSIPNNSVIWELRTFDFQNGAWTEFGNLIIPPNNNYNIADGFDISTDGDRIIVNLERRNDESDSGIGIYDLVNGQWVLQEIIDEFVPTGRGTAIRMSDDGKTFVFGNAWDLSVVSQTYVKVFQEFNGTWRELGELQPGAAHDETASGHIDITADGSRIVMGGIELDPSDPRGFVKVVDYATLVSTSELPESKVVEVFPNPSNGEVNVILSEGSGVSTVKLINSLGQVVFSDSISGPSYKLLLPNQIGVYYLQISDASSPVAIRKIIRSN